MPVWLRNFTYNEINEYYEKEKEAYEKASGKETVTANTDPNKLKSISQVQVPNFVTTAKRSKK